MSGEQLTPAEPGDEDSHNVIPPEALGDSDADSAFTECTQRRMSGESWHRRFLDHLRRCGNVSLAAEKSGVCRRTVYNHRDGDRRFAEAMVDALNEATDRLEARARKRAMQSSDRLMCFLLDRHRYRPVPTADRPAVPAVVRHELAADPAMQPLLDALASVLAARRERLQKLGELEAQQLLPAPPEAP
jgi:hypothetical protein